MKKLLLISILIFSCSPFSGIRESEKMNQNIFNFPRTSKNKLYELSLQYFAHSFKSAKAVLEYQNKEEGKIMGNIATSQGCAFNIYQIKYTITIEIKEGRARVTLEPRSMFHAKSGEMPITHNYYCPGDLPIEDDFKMINAEYKNFISKPYTKNTNW